MLSTIHIDSHNYGTRIKTVILINSAEEVEFYEKALTEDGQWVFRDYKFTFEKE